MPRRSTSRVLILLVLLAVIFSARIRKQMPDFEVYWQAGGRVVAGEPLYRAEDGHYRLKYLPAFALAMTPFSALPLGMAKAAWFAVVVAAIAALLALSWRWRPGPRGHPRWLAILTILLMAKFYLHELTLGQSNAVMAALVMLALAALIAGRERRAGVLLAGSVVVKPYAIAFLPYLALRRRWEALGWMGAGTVLALFAPAVIYGLERNRDLLVAWASTVRDSTAPNLLGQDNVSIWAMYAKWLGPGPPAFWLAVATLAGLTVAVMWLVAARGDLASGEYLEVAALLVILPLGSPQGWDYVLLTATPAVMLVLDLGNRLSRSARVAAIAAVGVMGFSVFDLMGRRAYAVFMSMSSITICALILLAALIELRRRRVA